MDQTSAEIKRDIDQTRQGMSDKLDVIEDRVKGTVRDPLSAVDLRSTIRRRPLESLAVALVGGAVLGMLRGSDQPVTAVEGTYRRLRHTAAEGIDQGRGLTDQITDQFADEIELLKGAILSAATAMAKDWVRDALPTGSSGTRRRQGSHNGHERSAV